MREAEVGEAKMARTLMTVRTLGRARGPRQRRPWVEVGDTDAAFVMLAESPHEIVLGFVGRPWPRGHPAETPATREAFVAYEPDDTVKVAMSLRVAPAEYGTLLVTETRIVVGPAAASHVRRLLARHPRRLRPRAPLPPAGNCTSRRGPAR